MLIDDLITAMRDGGEAGEQAILLLGRIIERFEWGRLDNGLSELLGEDYEPTVEEAERALSSLIAYLDTSAEPLPAAAWAVGLADRPEAEQCLSRVFDRAMTSGQDALAREALLGLADCEDEVSQRALLEARLAGSDAVRAAAEELTALD